MASIPITPVSIPLAISATAGPSPTDPVTIWNTLLANVAAAQPDYTGNLPLTLIEDISATDTGAICTMDQARVDAVNSVTPYGANPFILQQQGAMYGLPQGQPTNTSVTVIFSSSSVGLSFPAGFLVSDGSYQYAIQEAAVIGESGDSLATFAVATQPGSWTPGAGTVTQLASSLQSGYSATVTNPNAGTAGNSTGESVESYRSRILQGAKASAQSMSAMIKTALAAIPGVPANLISVVQNPTTGQLKVICGGGDPYQVALAIFTSTDLWPMLSGATASGTTTTVSIIEGPDTYDVSFVTPKAQTTTLSLTWQTSVSNFTQGSQVDQAGQTALLSWVNTITVGQPMNLVKAQSVFLAAVANLLSADQFESFTWAVTIGGSPVSPTSGTQLIPSDPEGYFSAAPAAVSVQQA